MACTYALIPVRSDTVYFCPSKLTLRRSATEPHGVRTSAASPTEAKGGSALDSVGDGVAASGWLQGRGLNNAARFEPLREMLDDAEDLAFTLANLSRERCHVPLQPGDFAVQVRDVRLEYGDIRL